MRKFIATMLMALSVCVVIAHAAGGFRLANGKLIEVGQTRSAVLALAGKPLDRHVERTGIHAGRGRGSVKEEVLTFRLTGSIGGKYLVVVTVENNRVVAVRSKQMDRL